MLEPVYKEVFRGRIAVREVFKITKVGIVAGCWLPKGPLPATIRSACCVTMSSFTRAKSRALRRFKDDVSEVKQGFECGVTIANFPT